MPRATLSLQLPDHVWISTLSKEHPDAEFTVLAAMLADDTGVGLVEISAADVEPIVAAIDGYESVTSVTVLEADAGRALVQFDTTEPLLILSLSEAGIPLKLPITIVDGEVTIELAAPREKLSELGTLLENFGIQFDLLSITQSIDTETLLTDDQYELLAEAVDRGYYDTPRTCTLTELAKAVGLAKSTTSEKLHRAEGTVLKEYVGGDTDAGLT
jgi:predicted DNA binding protein